MPRSRLSMRRVREVLRLSWGLGLSARQVARSCGLSHPTVLERPTPDWTAVHRELKRKGVTLQLLWDEYKAAHPTGYQYTMLCQRYRRWLSRLDVVMRQDHRAGEKLFVDYA